MDSNPLLAALQENYGDGSPPPPDTSTVRGLLAFCKLWLDGEVETEELNNPCMSMSGRLAGGAKATEQDLRQNPDLVESARAPIERTAEAYWALSEVLDKIPQLAAENDIEGYREAIEIFEEERQVVLDANAEIQSTLSGDVRICPRCGARSEDLCEPCGLVALYPDPQAAEQDRSKTAVLDPSYGNVYQAYTAVMSGKLSLPALYDPVAVLEEQLAEMRAGYEQVMVAESDEDEDTSGDDEGREVAGRLLRELQRSFEGIERLRNASESFRMSDLIRGWDAVFDAAVDMQRITRRYAKSLGLEGLAPESDSINLSGD